MSIQFALDASECSSGFSGKGLHQDCTISVDGRERVFHIFFPSAYDGIHLLPLLISLHGSSGYKPERAFWFYTAEREGFIAVYPEALKKEKWNIWGLKTETGGPDDIAFLDAVLDYMISHFSADPNRIYMHGQSMGDNMASYYAYHRSEKLAALAVTSGPVLPSVMYNSEGKLRFAPENHLPAARTHGAEDYACGLPSTYGISKEVIAAALNVPEQVNLRYTMDAMQKEVWKQINETSQSPLLYFDEEKNVEIYPGKRNDFMFYSIVGGAHRPTPNVFDMLWEGSLAGYYRNGSQCLRDPGTSSIKPDPDAIAFAGKSGLYYRQMQIRSMEEDGVFAEILDGRLYLSAVSIAKLFPHLDVVLSSQNNEAYFRFDNHEIQCAEGKELLLADGYAKPSPSPYRNGDNLMISAAHLLPLTGDFHAACQEDAAYITTHPFALTHDGASMIQEMLGVQKPTSPMDALAMEASIRQKIDHYLQKS